ncbi:Helix-turn-helix [Actinomyces bovis]|uniref:Helix-turn-helix n=1 Tax=Actinomyces bovis TaxID=1658 RepID=A0ABY1VQT4_9ACTO|nr:helix-turn-helix domain-containing protein [Actinomyces bovis]SPT53772.1 Helix-turn-helix [Actinomyces bovis]VEG53116.1 Helix-turn-helix [Actinomyces israelii]
MTIASEIKALAQEQGIPLADLAAAAGIARQTLSTKINGHSVFTVPEVVAIAAALGVSASSLVARAEGASPDAAAAPALADSAREGA